MEEPPGWGRGFALLGGGGGGAEFEFELLCLDSFLEELESWELFLLSWGGGERTREMEEVEITRVFWIFFMTMQQDWRYGGTKRPWIRESRKRPTSRGATRRGRGGRCGQSYEESTEKISSDSDSRRAVFKDSKPRQPKLRLGLSQGLHRDICLNSRHR